MLQFELHRTSGLKADVYLIGDDEIHAWASSRAHEYQIADLTVHGAPPEYLIDERGKVLSRMIRERSTAAPHPRTLAREIAARLLDAGSTTPPSPNDDFACESRNPWRLPTGFTNDPAWAMTRPQRPCSIASCTPATA